MGIDAKVVLGIDPGNNGAVVQLTKWDHAHEWRLEHVFRLEDGEDAIVEFLHAISCGFPDVKVYLEKVHGWGEGRSFNFGKYYGFVRGVCKTAFGVNSIVDVTPQTWMRAVEIPKQDVSKKAEHRQAIRRIAAEWISAYGEMTTTNWNAAAALIACYGVYQEEHPEG